MLRDARLPLTLGPMATTVRPEYRLTLLRRDTGGQVRTWVRECEGKGRRTHGYRVRKIRARSGYLLEYIYKSELGLVII